MEAISISSKNSKMGHVSSISLLPVTDCRNCTICKRTCYAVKIMKLRPNVRGAWHRNSTLAYKHRDEYFKRIAGYLELARPRYFRWHVAGDIKDQDYLDRMKELARKYPTTKFFAFTKSYDLAFRRLPKNLKIRVSRWPGDEDDYDAIATPSARRLPQAWMQDGSEDRIPSDALECPGGCDACGVCMNLTTDVWFHKH